jgi:uncharacterized protein
MRIQRYAEHAVQPWKNGRGIARRIAAWPAGVEGHGDEMLWHVSLPEIAASGAFSALAGLDRHWMLLEGAGIELHCTSSAPRIDFRRRIETPLDQVAFSGDWTTDCTLLAGPVLALSAMTRRGRAGAALHALTVGTASPVEKRADDAVVVLVVSGQVRVLANGEGGAPLDHLDAIVGTPGRYESYSLSQAGWEPARVVIVTLSVIAAA